MPKEPVLNLLWRQDWIRKASSDPAARKNLIEACRASCVLTCNLLFWSYLKNQIDENGKECDPISPHYPAITWPVQDRGIETIVDCIKKREPVVSWKTREMGNSWMVLWVFDWFMLFHENMDFLVMSRTQELVDSADDPDSLFWKLRYLNSPERMPEFIVPTSGKYKLVDKLMHVSNPKTHSHIDGRATTSHSGAGGRRNAVFFDEFSRVADARMLWETMTDTNKCRIAVSTPLQGSFHNRLYTEKKVRSIFMPWWEHPWKGRGVVWQREKPSDTAMDVDGWYAVSPWYDLQRSTRSASDLAENVDCNPKGAAESYFNGLEVDRHAREHACPPSEIGELLYDTETDPTQVDQQLRGRIWESVRWLSDRKGPWSLWIDLEEDERTGVLRPPQGRGYVAFADISKGSGASNTVFAFYDVETRAQVAEYASPHIAPHNAARLFVAAATWFGGVFAPFLGWEANGDGITFGDEVVKLEYPALYFQETVGTLGSPQTKRYGWSSNTGAKVLLIGQFRTAIERDGVIVRSRATLDECLEYIRYEDQGVGPASLSEDKSGARAAHGDRVVANAGCVLLLDKYQGFNFERINTPPAGSFSFRQRQRQMKKRMAELQEW